MAHGLQSPWTHYPVSFARHPCQSTKNPAMNMIVCPPVSTSPNLPATLSLGGWMPHRLNRPDHEALGQQIVLNPAQAATVYRPLDMATVLDLLYG